MGEDGVQPEAAVGVVHGGLEGAHGFAARGQVRQPDRAVDAGRVGGAGQVERGREVAAERVEVDEVGEPVDGHALGRDDEVLLALEVHLAVGGDLAEAVVRCQQQPAHVIEAVLDGDLGGLEQAPRLVVDPESARLQHQAPRRRVDAREDIEVAALVDQDRGVNDDVSGVDGEARRAFLDAVRRPGEHVERSADAAAECAQAERVGQGAVPRGIDEGGEAGDGDLALRRLARLFDRSHDQLACLRRARQPERPAGLGGRVERQRAALQAEHAVGRGRKRREAADARVEAEVGRGVGCKQGERAAAGRVGEVARQPQCVHADDAVGEGEPGGERVDGDGPESRGGSADRGRERHRLRVRAAARHVEGERETDLLVGRQVQERDHVERLGPTADRVGRQLGEELRGHVGHDPAAGACLGRREGEVERAVERAVREREPQRAVVDLGVVDA